MMLLEDKLFKLALNDPVDVARLQISWLGKNSDELTIMDSTYRADLEQKFYVELLQIQGLNNPDFSAAKKTSTTLIVEIYSPICLQKEVE